MLVKKSVSCSHGKYQHYFDSRTDYLQNSEMDAEKNLHAQNLYKVFVGEQK